MARDKKRRHGRPRFVLLEAPARPRVVDDLTPADLERAWRELRVRFPGGAS